MCGMQNYKLCFISEGKNIIQWGIISLLESSETVGCPLGSVQSSVTLICRWGQNILDKNFGTVGG